MDEEVTEANFQNDMIIFSNKLFKIMYDEALFFDLEANDDEKTQSSINVQVKTIKLEELLKRFEKLMDDTIEFRQSNNHYRKYLSEEAYDFQYHLKRRIANLKELNAKIKASNEIK